MAWPRWWLSRSGHTAGTPTLSPDGHVPEHQRRRSKWSFGVMEDHETDQVPGSVLLLSSRASKHNAPLGMRHARRRTSASSVPSPYLDSERAQSPAIFRHASHGHDAPDKKRTADGKIILEPQPEESANDPLNWAAWRRDLALVSLGLYCMVGGGMTPILAAGFPNVAATFDVTQSQVAYTTGLYMLGLGVGSVIWSPTAILFGKRPIYLFTSVLFILSAIWCGLSPNYASLVVARVFQGIAVAPVECLPSATIAEIFFLHERAYRLGIYTLLLLGGKNLSPLASAAIIQRLDWRWVFYILACVVAFAGLLLFLFVPETFWDRSPSRGHEHQPSALAAALKKYSSSHGLFRDPERGAPKRGPTNSEEKPDHSVPAHPGLSGAPLARRRQAHSGGKEAEEKDGVMNLHEPTGTAEGPIEVVSAIDAPALGSSNCLSHAHSPTPSTTGIPADPLTPHLDRAASLNTATPKADARAQPNGEDAAFLPPYTQHWREAPAKTFLRTLKPWDGRFRNDNWLKVALRPFILYAYPSILWSAGVYACSVGWLIVLSESASEIYRSADTYGFSALQVGLVYISPFIGGVLGTAVAGKLSDVIVRAMAHANGGVYEPEFRLVMALPIALSTGIGLFGYGWSAANGDSFWVPTVFFGVISFGCSLGSTTSITFAVDSYRQYAGEALVTLNFTKNVLHGLVFSLFFNRWLEAQGAKTVFLALGGIQLGILLWTVPVYIYGKRCRMWTVRANLMEKL